MRKGFEGLHALVCERLKEAGHTHLNFGKQYNHYNLYEAY
jgi:hypothetical protein